MGPDLRTAFIGTYPPRRCGIATFTRDLSDGMRAANDGLRSMVVAVTDADGPYAYPAEVEFQIRQGSKADYTRSLSAIPALSEAASKPAAPSRRSIADTDGGATPSRAAT